MTLHTGSAPSNRKDVRRIPLPSGRVEEILSQFSSPSRLGTIYRDDLKRAQRTRTCLHANVVDIETDSSAQKVLSVLVKTLSGRSFRVEAEQFVLACGGIDNARLLLVSNKVQAAGLGNANDLVGRYFSDHPRLTLGNARLKPQWKQNKLYDQKFHYLNRAVSANGTFVSAQFSITREVQEREGLLNALLWFSSVFPGEGTRSAEALIRMKHRVNGKAGRDFGELARDLALLARHPINTAGFLAARLLQPEWLIHGVNIEVICEPSPNRDSRVTLSNVRDHLGVAGSSVFPTYGANFPTFTIVALGLRLADHLAEVARRPDAILERASEIGAAHPEFEQEPAAAFTPASPQP